MGRTNGWFRRMGTEDGHWWQVRPRNIRLSPTSWRWKRRTVAVATSDGSHRVRRRRRGLLDVLYGIMFHVLSFVEAIVLVATLCFFYLRFGCQL